MRALALLALALAGCVAVPPPEPGPDPPADPGPLLVRSVQVDASRWSGEPSIVALADGTLLITGAGGMTRYAEDPSDAPGNAGQSYLWRSTDGGANWTFVDLGLPDPARGLLPYRSAVLGVEGDLAAGAEGNVYFVDLTMLATQGVSMSQDAGATWQEAGAPVAGIVGTDRPWIAADPGAEGGVPSVVVKYLQLATGYRVAYFAPVGPALEPRGDFALPACGQGPIVADRLDPVPPAMVYRMACSDGGISVLTIPQFPAIGADFEVERVEGPPGAQVADGIGPVLAVGTRGAGIGNVSGLPGAWALAWADVAGGKSRILMSWSLDEGRNWTEPLQLNAPGTTGIFPWADMGGTKDPVLAVTWYEAAGEGDPDTHKADWVPMHAVMRWQFRDGAWGLSDPVITALSDQPAHSGAICTQGLNCNIQGRSHERRLLDFFEVDVDQAGTSHVAWTDNSGDFPTIWYSQVAAPPS